MRTLLTIHGNKAEVSDADVERCFAAVKSDGLWLDIDEPTDDDYRLLEDVLKFHPLTIEDIKHQNQRPKLDEYPDYNFAVIFQAEWTADEIALREHHLYVGPNYLITVHVDPSQVLADLQKRLTKSPDLSNGQPAFLIYLVV